MILIYFEGSSSLVETVDRLDVGNYNDIDNQRVDPEILVKVEGLPTISSLALTSTSTLIGVSTSPLSLLMLVLLRFHMSYFNIY